MCRPQEYLVAAVDPRWKEVLDLYETMQIAHPHIRAQGRAVLKYLSDKPLRYVGEDSPDNVLVQAPQWSSNQTKFSIGLLWADILSLGRENLTVADKGIIAPSQDIDDCELVFVFVFSFVLFFYGFTDELIENWISNGPALQDTDPHYNFVSIWHESPQGLKRMQIQWPDSPGIDFLDSDSGSSTYTQPGCITLPHVDGYGEGQRLAHLYGTKIWIVWPPTRKNLSIVRKLTIGPPVEVERRIEFWFNKFEDPQIFLVRAKDSFDLGPSAVHACISITMSAHFGRWIWRKEGYEVGKLWTDIFLEQWEAYNAAMSLRRRERKLEDKLSRTEVAQRSLDLKRMLEDQVDEECRENYKMWVKNWEPMGSRAFNKIADENNDEAMKEWLRMVKQFHATLKKVLK